LTRLRYGLARLLLKASTDFSIVPAWVTTSVLTPTFRGLTRDGYQRSSAFFACVSALAFAFPEPPLLVYDDEGDAGRPLPQHGLRRLLRNPMPTMGEAELFATTMVYMAIGGNAYWHKIRGRGNQVIQLKPYHAGQIMPVPGGPNWIKEYLYDQLGTGGMGATMGTLPRIDPADIVHFKWPSVDPSQPWMSQPPIVAAATEVDADVEASRYVFALLQNDAVPRTVVTIPADRPLLDGEYERIKEQWKERYGGDRRGDVAVLEAGASVSRMSLNLQEMAFEAMAKLPESRIAAVMRVPPIIAGLNVGLDRSTFSNYGEARKAFAQDTLATLWRLVASEVAADLLPEFAGMGGVDARFDLSRVAALQEDTTAKFNRTVNVYKAGLVTRNEGRRMLGLGDAVAAGDEYYGAGLKPAAAPPQIEDSAKPKTLLLLGDGTFVDLPFGAAEVIERATRSRAARGGGGGEGRTKEDATGISDLESKTERAMVRYLRGEYRKAAEGVRDAAKADTIDPEIIEQLGLDLGPGAQGIMRRIYPLVLQRAFEDAELALDVNIAWDVKNEEVQAVLGNLAELIVRITETTRTAIQGMIGEAIDEGWSLDRLAKALVERGAITSRERAKLIAVTETASAYSMGSLLAYTLSGVVESVEWVATLDKETCSDCRALDGEARPLAEAAFSDGTAHPPHHPRCRCALAPIIKKG
jgi:HK97 family phage portal protein